MEYVELEPKLNDFVLAAGLDWDYKCQSEIELLVLFKTRCCCSGKKKSFAQLFISLMNSLTFE